MVTKMVLLMLKMDKYILFSCSISVTGFMSLLEKDSKLHSWGVCLLVVVLTLIFYSLTFTDTLRVTEAGTMVCVHLFSVMMYFPT